jgi:hypothetical protein
VRLFPDIEQIEQGRAWFGGQSHGNNRWRESVQQEDPRLLKNKGYIKALCQNTWKLLYA